MTKIYGPDHPLYASSEIRIKFEVDSGIQDGIRRLKKTIDEGRRPQRSPFAERILRERYMARRARRFLRAAAEAHDC